ncbi:MAG: hypothetical protein D6815_04020 [Candidatus Dadabacteria bacterium]|nr:MAG: hypothetical protein D6815_04020 [Candidatus Dadabacteria bacterium]
MASAEWGGERFLRAINIEYDIAEPERIAHFRPTSKSVALVRRLIDCVDERAFFVTAPYGSGKSLSCAVVMQLVDNAKESAPVLLSIAKRVARVNPSFARSIRRRIRGETRGLSVALNGEVSSVAEGLKTAVLAAMRRARLGRQARSIERLPARDVSDAVRLLDGVRDKLRAAGRDRLLIVWDEFGRHVQALAEAGRHSALADVQALAEYAARSEEVPVVFAALLHQGLLHYAGALPQSVRREWTKIEGRFERIEYIEDSNEIVRLIADVVHARFGNRERPSLETAQRLAKRCLALEYFHGFGAEELGEILQRAYPLEPVALAALPRIAARVAQNERTLFTFLLRAPWSGRMGLGAVYDYFSAAMRSDLGIGGAHKPWIETESALSKATGGSLESEVLKAACVLRLGRVGGRARVRREQLVFAVSGFSEREEEAQEAVDRLISRKLLLHRVHNDEVSVWHGTDVDLRGRLAAEKKRRRGGFSALQYLTKHVPPPTWRPVEYNTVYGVRRFFSGQYVGVEALEAHLRFTHPVKALPVGCDGKIFYVLAGSHEEIERAEGVVQRWLRDKRLLVAIPREPLPVGEVALELHCLRCLERDPELVGQDPMIRPELAQMADDAQQHLRRLLDRLLIPSPDGARWFYRRKEGNITSVRDLRRKLSAICRSVFPKTPVFWNEVINRRRPSAVMVNARKKLLMAILERSGEAGLGIVGDFPDASMFRTLLLRTGLYREEGGRWGYAHPKAIADPGLAEVWEQVRVFFTRPDTEAKRPGELLRRLMEPPFGVRPGVLPVLIAAGLRAFPTALSVTRDGEYVQDLLPSDIEELCKRPERYRVRVFELTRERVAYLHRVRKIFQAVDFGEAAEPDLVRLCYDALEAWKAQLPAAALQSRVVSPEARALQRLLRRQTEPARLLFEKFPEALAFSIEDLERATERLTAARDGLLAVTRVYAAEAVRALARVLEPGAELEKLQPLSVVHRWASCFGGEGVDFGRDRQAKAFVSVLLSPAANDEQALANALGSLILGRPLSRWDDSSVVSFERQVQAVARRIEDFALACGELELDGGTRRAVARLLAARARRLLQRLESLVGEDALHEAVWKDVFPARGGKNRGGDHTRSARGSKESLDPAHC